MVAVFVGVIGWQMRELHLYNAAVREAKEAGFEWTCTDTISLIQQDWRNALKKETWSAHPRILVMGKVADLGHYREMLHRLRPTELYARGCENVDALKGLTDLQRFGLTNCDALKNLDGLKGLVALHTLDIRSCRALQNVDGLKGLTGLQKLFLTNCYALENVDALKDLTGLQTLVLRFCPALQNVDVLKGLSGLQTLSLVGSKIIPAAALLELRVALPNTHITFPDHTGMPQ